MQKIVNWVVNALLGSIFSRIEEWFTRKQAQEAKRKAEELQALIKSKEEAGALEEEMAAAKDELYAVYKEGTAYTEKLEILRKAAEARRMAKVRKELQK